MDATMEGDARLRRPRWLRRLLAIGAIGSVVLAVGAGGPWRALAQPAAPPPSGSSLTTGIRETILPNGLTVLTKEVRSAPVVSVSVWYRVGSRNEHTGITGVSHLLEHMMFKGTKTYRVGEIPRTLFVNGASFNASTFYDWTNYYATLAADRLELVLAMEADRMAHSRIDKADLDSEMTVVRSELEGGENSPGQLLWQAVSATAFWAHPYHWPIIGWRSDVEHVSRDAIYRYYRTYYGPNNATLVVIGDFETEAVLALVRKHFGKVSRIPPPPPVYTTEPPQRGERRVTLRRAGPLPMALIAYKAPDGKSPDSYALDVVGIVLGEGRTSRLYQALVERELASRVDAGWLSLHDPSLFTLSATARPGVTAERLEAALADEVERVRSTPVSDEELARAKRQIEADFVMRADSVTAQARQIGYWAMVDDWRYLITYLDRIRALDAAAIQAVARRYLIQETRTVGHFVPTADGGPTGPPPGERSARVERPQRGDRPVPLPKLARITAGPRNVTRFTLDNGISVVVRENQANPTFALRGSLSAGGIVEPRDKPGLASLTAAMLTRGTERHGALAFATELESVGASLAATGDTLVTMLSGQALSQDFDRVMDLLAEMLTQPAFPPADLERLRGQVLADLERARDDPESVADRAFERAVYPEGNPLRPETLEEARTALTTITRDDVLAFYRRQYGPEGMILVISGDVRADRVRQALTTRLGAWPRNREARPLPQLDVQLQPAPRREVIVIPDKSQASIVWGHAGGLRRSDPDYYATQVMNLILGGGGLVSRLSAAIRDERGLAYSVGSDFDATLYPGPFQVVLGTNPANVMPAVATLRAELVRMRDSGVTRREVDEAVAYLTGRFPVRLETNDGMADILWAIEFYALGTDYIERYADHYRSVTVAQVNLAARQHLHPDRATLVIAGTVPEEAAR